MYVLIAREKDVHRKVNLRLEIMQLLISQYFASDSLIRLKLINCKESHRVIDPLEYVPWIVEQVEFILC